MALVVDPGLDSLYRQVFKVTRPTDCFDEVLGAIMYLCTPFTITQLGVLLTLETDDICLAVTELKSILSIPISNDAVISCFAV